MERGGSTFAPRVPSVAYPTGLKDDYRMAWGFERFVSIYTGRCPAIANAF